MVTRKLQFKGFLLSRLTFSLYTLQSSREKKRTRRPRKRVPLFDRASVRRKSMTDLITFPPRGESRARDKYADGVYRRGKKWCRALRRVKPRDDPPGLYRAAVHASAKFVQGIEIVRFAAGSRERGGGRGDERKGREGIGFPRRERTQRRP